MKNINLSKAVSKYLLNRTPEQVANWATKMKATRIKNDGYRLSNNVKEKIRAWNIINKSGRKLGLSNIGKKYSATHKKKISEGYQKHHFDICQCCICNLKRGEYVGKNNHFFGKKHSIETIEKIRIATKKGLNTEIAKLHLRQRPLQKQFKNTKIELKLQNLLKAYKIIFKTHSKAIIGQPDIFIEPNICIFADGCYWHACPIHYPIKNIDKTKKDIKNTENLQKKGYIVLRFWEHDINEHIEKCEKTILQTINTF